MKEFTNEKIKKSLGSAIKKQISHYQGIKKVLSQKGESPEKQALLKRYDGKHAMTVIKIKDMQIAELNYMLSITKMDDDDFEHVCNDFKFLISDGNNKTGHNIMTYSVVSGTTCPYATPRCLKICYDIKAYWRSTVFLARIRNTFISLLPEKVLYERFKTALKKKEQRILRIHEGGEFYNVDYAKKIDNICARLIEEKLIDIAYGYTKNIHYMPIFKAIRMNFSIMSDTPKQYISLAKNSGYYVFKAIHKNEDYSGIAGICSGDCSKCSFCYDNRVNVEIKEH